MGDRAFRSPFFMLDYGIHTEKMTYICISQKALPRRERRYANT